MKIAVLSDIHDHVDNLHTSLTKAKHAGCEHIICCGDFCSPFVIPHLLSSGLHINAIFGNNDADVSGIYQLTKPDQMEITNPAQEYGEVSFVDTKIAFCHYPHLAKLLAGTDQFTAVFHGHTHQAYMEHMGHTLIANPGSVCGIISGQYGPATLGIFDTSSKSFEHIYLFK